VVESHPGRADATDGDAGTDHGVPGEVGRSVRSARDRLSTDRRATTTTVNYLLAIGIVSLLVSGLLIAGGGVLDDQRQGAVRDQLDTVGNRMAGEIVAVDRLSRSGGDVTITVDRPEQVGGSTYRAELVTGPGCSSPSCLELTATATDTTVTVPVGNRTPVTMTRDGDVWWVNSSRSVAGAKASAEADVELNVDPSIGVAKNVDTSPPIGRAINIVNERPLAGFRYEPDTPGVGRTVTFRNDTRDIDGQVTNFSWDFDGDDTFDTVGPDENETTYTYSDPGRYDARLMVTDDDGDTGNATKRLTVSGVVYQRDAVAIDHDPGNSIPGGIEFSVRNEFDSNASFDGDVTLEQLTINPENATNDRLEEGDDVSDELRVTTTNGDSDAEDYDNSAGGLDLDATAGSDVPLNVDLNDGERADFVLSEFRPNVNASEETYEMTLKYRVDTGDTDQLYYYRFTVEPDPPGAAAPPPTSPPSSGSGGVLYAVNAGGPATTIDGIDYESDTGGDPSTYLDATAGTTADAPDISDIDGTSKDDLYLTERYADGGNMRYEFPTGDGTYKITLRFAEDFFSSDEERVFDVSAEGQTVRDDLDIYDEVGFGTAYDVNYTVEVTDGELDVVFDNPTENNPTVSAIEVRRVAYQQTDPNSVVVEAEGFTNRVGGTGDAASSEWEVTTPGGSAPSGTASGGAYMLATPKSSSEPQDDSTQGARLDYTIDFTDTGTYNVFTRLASENGGSNSVHVGIDSETPASYGSNAGHDVSSAKEDDNEWVWVDDSADGGGSTQIEVNSAGEHTIRVWVREGGVKFDKLVLTKSASSPTGTGPPVGSLRPPGPVGPPVSAPASGPPASLHAPTRRTVVGAGVDRPEVAP
jgi:hypothetical protein